MNNFLKNLASLPLILILITLSFPIKTLGETVGIHTLFAVKGKVTVNRKTWKNPQTRLASEGLTLTSDDKLTVYNNASVKVYCSNQQIWEVKPGKYNVSSGCPSGNPVIRLPNSNNDTLRPLGITEAALAKLPYLITPRNTKIITNRPQLKWNNVPGTTNYTVKIDADGFNWKTQTNKTEITYPGKLPLQQETQYWVTIETDKGVSSPSENDNPVGFTLLDEQTKKTVLDAVKTLKKQSLSPEEKGLILAQLYRGYELYGDAIEVLEELVNQGSQEVAVYQLLGNTYLEIGLPQLAKKPYEKALKLAIN